LTSKNDVWIALCNMCREDTSVKFNWKFTHLGSDIFIGPASRPHSTDLQSKGGRAACTSRSHFWLSFTKNCFFETDFGKIESKKTISGRNVTSWLALRSSSWQADHTLQHRVSSASARQHHAVSTHLVSRQRRPRSGRQLAEMLSGRQVPESWLVDAAVASRQLRLNWLDDVIRCELQLNPLLP